MSKDSKGEIEQFMSTLKIHNKDIGVCFNDAVAVAHLQALLATETQKALDYGSWLEPKCDLHEKYTSACCGCQKANAVYYAIDDYKDYIKSLQKGQSNE